jgi:hypothetical protein
MLKKQVRVTKPSLGRTSSVAANWNPVGGVAVFAPYKRPVHRRLVLKVALTGFILISPAWNLTSSDLVVVGARACCTWKGYSMTGTSASAASSCHNSDLLFFWLTESIISTFHFYKYQILATFWWQIKLWLMLTLCCAQQQAKANGLTDNMGSKKPSNEYSQFWFSQLE